MRKTAKFSSQDFYINNNWSIREFKFPACYFSRKAFCYLVMFVAVNIGTNLIALKANCQGLKRGDWQARGGTSRRVNVLSQLQTTIIYRLIFRKADKRINRTASCLADL